MRRLFFAHFFVGGAKGGGGKTNHTFSSFMSFGGRDEALHPSLPECTVCFTAREAHAKKQSGIRTTIDYNSCSGDVAACRAGKKCYQRCYIITSAECIECID